MKMLVLQGGGEGLDIQREFARDFDNHYADRFIRHIVDDDTLCTGCGKQCDHCRWNFDLDFSANIEVVQTPKTLPYFIDEPGNVLKLPLPPHDVLVAINIHEDILLSLPELSKASKGQAIIVPLEHPEWITRWARDEILKKCKELGLESAFPKPFCSMEKGHGPVIDRFIEEFKIGRPSLRIEMDNDRVITSAEVDICAPCGNTYFVAKNLIGKKADEKINEWVAKYWHSFPCVASMKMDSELGDTILHKGGYIHYETVGEAIEKADSSKVKKAG